MAASTTALPDSDETETDVGSRSRRPLVVGLVGLLLVATSVWWFVLRSGPDDEAATEPPAEGAVVEVAQMTANLAGEELHYARFAFALVLADEHVAADVEPRFALLKDAALSVAQTFDQERLRSPEGTEEFRAALTEHARRIYPEGEVLRVVLTELLVQ